MVYDDMTVTTEFSPDRDIYEVYEIFDQFLIAMGFSAISVQNAGLCEKCKKWKEEE